MKKRDKSDESLIKEIGIRFKEFRESIKKSQVRTYKYRDNKLEFYFYDCGGKFLGKKDIPYIVPFYPDWGFTELFKIKNDRLYQLIENEGDEVWELHVTPLN